jgi:hypothetical protein
MLETGGGSLETKPTTLLYRFPVTQLTNDGAKRPTLEIGDCGEGIDVRAMQERWEKSKVYSVVPEEVSLSLNMLVRRDIPSFSRKRYSCQLLLWIWEPTARLVVEAVISHTRFRGGL